MDDRAIDAWDYFRLRPVHRGIIGICSYCDENIREGEQGEGMFHQACFEEWLHNKKED